MDPMRAFLTEENTPLGEHHRHKGNEAHLYTGVLPVILQ